MVAIERKPHDVSQSYGPWLFDICNDPEEKDNLYGDDMFSDIQKLLEAKLEAYRKQQVPPLYNTPENWQADPYLHNGSWSPGWCDANVYAAAFEGALHAYSAVWQ